MHISFEELNMQQMRVCNGTLLFFRIKLLITVRGINSFWRKTGQRKEKVREVIVLYEF